MPAPEPRSIADWRHLARHAPTKWRARLTTLAAALRQDNTHAWISSIDDDTLGARLDALQAAAGSAEPVALPLLGVPFAVKDNIDVAGYATTAACPAWSHRPARDAHAVARLLAAGAVCVGKTNLDQFATGLVGTRSPYGRPASVADAARVSGGSSSGSAVAVARGHVPFALGTDTAGSGRIPAAFNGIVGLKPTPGRVGTSGVLPACRSLDCVSVFANDVADAAHVLAVMEGPDADDAYSAFQPGPARWPSTLRIGIPAQAAFEGDAGYAAAFERVVAELEAAGHAVVPVDFAPLHAVAELLYGGPWVAERVAVVEALLAEQPDAIDPTVRRVLQPGRSMSAVDAFRGQYALKAAQASAARLWQGLDTLMVPSAPGHPRFAEVDADPLGANARLGLYTNFVNLLGWCAIAIPAGQTARGLPFGVTFIAPAHHDAALVRFAASWRNPGSSAAPAAPAASAAEGTLRQPASAPIVPVAVVGAHLSGLPFNHQLTERGAVLRAATRTAPLYRLHALPGTTPARPGLVRVGPASGVAIEVEVWDVPVDRFGSLVALAQQPLGIGTVELDDGTRVHGYLCEAIATEGAPDISGFGGWRAYLASLA